MFFLAESRKNWADSGGADERTLGEDRLFAADQTQWQKFTIEQERRTALRFAQGPTGRWVG
jgi:hypothetical protein